MIAQVWCCEFLQVREPHQEPHKAQVCISRAEALQVEDAQDGLAALRHLRHRALEQERAEPLALIQWPLS